MEAVQTGHYRGLPLVLPSRSRLKCTYRGKGGELVVGKASVQSDFDLVTDPAEELELALRRVIKVPDSNELTYQVFQNTLFPDASTVEYLDLIAILRRRLENLRTFLEGLTEPELNRRNRRDDIAAAIGKFAYLLEPKAQASLWAKARQVGPVSENATVLGWFSTVVSRHKRLRKLSDEERLELILKFEDVQKNIQNQGLPAWALEPLHDGLRRLLLALKHLEFLRNRSCY
jgi:hypothetical protein